MARSYAGLNQQINSIQPLPISSLRIIFQNVNGWELNKILHKQFFSKYNPDIILINDTGINQEQIIKFYPYICYHTNNENVHSGAAIFVKPNIEHKRINPKKFHHDTVAITVETKTGPIIIATNYHPPRRDYHIYEDLDWLGNHTIPCYLFADLNSHHNSFPFHAQQNARGKILFEDYIEHGKLRRLGPNFPTVFMHNSNQGTTPDILLCNRSTYHNFHHRCLPATCSDHLPIQITIASKPIFKINKHESTKTANWNGYTENIKDNSYVVNLRSQPGPPVEGDRCLQEFIANIQNARDKFIPRPPMVTRPFIPTSPKFRRLSKVLNNIQNLYANTGDANIRHHLRNQRRQIVHLLREEGKKLASEHWDDLLNKTALKQGKEPRSFWKNIKRFQGSKKQGIQITTTGDNKGDVITDPAAIECTMRGVWKDKFYPPPRENIHEESIQEMEEFFAANPTIALPYNIIDFSRLIYGCKYSGPITPLQIYIEIRLMQLKAPGEDTITKEHLEHLPKIALVILAHIFTAYLACGYFPNIMKSALLAFIPKPDKPRCDPNNYRPISLLSVIGKIYGRILTKRLTAFLRDNNLEHPNQYGFTNGRGTESSLAISYEFVAKQLSFTHNQTVSIISRDIKGAFDHLDHQRVKYHLSTIGLPILLSKALCHFLDGRTAKIKINKLIGDAFPLLAGAPQGASPSAKLYNLVIRLAPISKIPRYYFSNYADDCHKIVVTQGKMNVHEVAITNVIKEHDEFELREGLITEPTKSWILTMYKKNTPNIIIRGVRYPTKKSKVKILGLKISYRSFIASHVTQQRNRAEAALRDLYRFRPCKTSIKMLLIKTQVLPHLMYPCIPLHLASKSQMCRLQAIQNKALRFAYAIRYSPDTPTPTAESLHNREYPMLPVNQKLYWRAKRLWEKVETGQAGNPAMYTAIKNLTVEGGYNTPYKCFPSSIDAIARPEPDPIYTWNTNPRGRAVNDNLARIRRVIYTHYLHDDEENEEESDWESDSDTDHDTDTDV